MSILRLACAALISTLLVAPSLARSAPLQEPKIGSVWYEENVDLGFRVKSPKDWDFIPPSPLDANLVGKYAPPNGTYVSLGGSAVVFLSVWLVKFDRRAAAGKSDADTSKPGMKEMVLEAGTAKDLEAWMSGGIDEGSGWHRTEEIKPLKGAGVPAKWTIYEGQSTNGSGTDRKPVRCYAATFELSPEVDVALVGIGPADGKWRVYEKAFETMAKSFQRMQVVGTKAAPTTGTEDPRAEKRARLQADVAKSPGWTLYETPNYFLISSYNDKQFIEELKVRLESIRAVFEKDYPPSKARHIKVAMAEEEDGGDDGDDEDGKPAEGEEPSDDEDHSVAPTTIDPLLLSRCSVVRVCKDRDQYIQYGGPPGTGGYWLSIAEELVVFDDKAVQGTAATWGTLNHEAFHQYIFYFYGAIAPHSWYNEGTGDYYSGFEFKNGKFKAGPSIGRKSNLKDITSQGRHVPLQEFVRWSKSKYYGQNDRKLQGYECYAQGWSLIWFLRTGQGNAKGWQKSWSGILDRYLETLLDTGDLDKAVDKAFEGIDWKAFESSWLDYIG